MLSQELKVKTCKHTPADEPTSEENDPSDKRNRLRARPQSLVLLAAHRMIGIFGQIGGYNTIDIAEAPEWSTDRVNQIIEDIIEECDNTFLELHKCRDSLQRKPNFPIKEEGPH